MTRVLSDHWICNYVVAGVTYQIDGNCGSEHPNCTSMSVVGPSRARIFEQPLSLDSSTHTYSFTTYANTPDTWPAGVYKFKLHGPPPVLTIRQLTYFFVGQNTLTNITFSTPVLPSSLIAIQFLQYGTDSGGGPLAAPTLSGTGTWSSGSSLASKRGYSFHGSAPGTSTVAQLHTNGAQDLAFGAAWEIQSPTPGWTLTPTIVDGHAAALVAQLAAGYAYPAFSLVLFCCHRYRTSPTTFVNESSGLGGTPTWYNYHNQEFSIVGGTPLFEHSNMLFAGALPASAGIAAPTLTGNQSRAYDCLLEVWH
jgi:hypothetical protein